VEIVRASFGPNSQIPAAAKALLNAAPSFCPSSTLLYRLLHPFGKDRPDVLKPTPQRARVGGYCSQCLLGLFKFTAMDVGHRFGGDNIRLFVFRDDAQ